MYIKTKMRTLKGGKVLHSCHSALETNPSISVQAQTDRQRRNLRIGWGGDKHMMIAQFHHLLRCVFKLNMESGLPIIFIVCINGETGGKTEKQGVKQRNKGVKSTYITVGVQSAGIYRYKYSTICGNLSVLVAIHDVERVE